MDVVKELKKQNETLVKLWEVIDHLDDHIVSLTVAVEEHKWAFLNLFLSAYWTVSQATTLHKH